MIQPVRGCGLAAGAANPGGAGEAVGVALGTGAGAGSLAAAGGGEVAVARGPGVAGSGGRSCSAVAAGCGTDRAGSTGSAFVTGATWSEATGALCVPARTMRVFTSTGRIGSVEPITALGDAAA